jgi:hypothetical protein
VFLQERPVCFRQRFAVLEPVEDAIQRIVGFDVVEAWELRLVQYAVSLAWRSGEDLIFAPKEKEDRFV